QDDDAAFAGELAQHRHQQAQFADAGLAADELGEHAQGPAVARQLGIEPGMLAAERPDGAVAQLPGPPYRRMRERGLAAHVARHAAVCNGLCYRARPVRSRPTPSPSSANWSCRVSTRMGSNSGFSGSSWICAPWRRQRLTVTSSPMRATTIWPLRTSWVRLTASRSPSRMPASRMLMPR